MSKAFTDEQNRNAQRFLRRLVHERFDGHYTKTAEALGVSQPLISSMLSGTGGFGMKLLTAMSRLTNVPMQAILDGEAEEQDGSSAELGEKEFLRVYRGAELAEAQAYLADEGDRALRMAGTWSAAQFRDHFVRGFGQWREVQRVGADTPAAVAKVHDSRATPLARDPKKGPRRAER